MDDERAAAVLMWVSVGFLFGYVVGVMIQAASSPPPAQSLGTIRFRVIEDGAPPSR